jgi:pimeloyl-ACP methyl ester carboxylesterase
VPGRRETILASASGILADLDSGDGEHVDGTRLAGIETPVTIVDARLGPDLFRRSVEDVRTLMPQARHVTLEHSSHIVMLDAREEMLDVLRRAVTEPARISRRTS